MSSKSKRQQTMAKRNREQAVEEKRRLKREKKQAAAAARNAPEGVYGETLYGPPEKPAPDVADEPPSVEPIHVE